MDEHDGAAEANGTISDDSRADRWNTMTNIHADAAGASPP